MAARTITMSELGAAVAEYLIQLSTLFVKI